ncbi:MAG TPA: WYL domain-containing protein [Acidimicrobiales bacterium]|nr:WYL domain-containing protein [Acidimicrobiales bacterium]
MADPVERITELLMILLETPVPLTLAEIGERSGLYESGDESSRKRFERDKRTLRELGVPIETTIEEGDAGASRYRIRPEDYFLADLDLTPAETVALQMAVSAVRMEVDWDEQAVLKLGGTRGVAAPLVADLPAPESLPVLFEAMTTHRPTRFRYSGRDREVALYGVLYRYGHWYATGADRGDGDRVKAFRVDRIEGAARVGEGETYRIPEGFDPGSVLQSDALLLGSGGETVARVLLDHTVAPTVLRARAGTGPANRQADGSVVIDVPVRNRGAFRSWLLGLGTHAEVLEPAELRADIVGWLTSMVGEVR